MNRTLFHPLLHLAVAVAAAIGWVIVGPVAASASDADAAYTDEECIACHRSGSDESDLQMSAEEYKASAHGDEIGCRECHTLVVDDAHQTTEGSGAVDCAACHEQENRHGMKGAVGDRPLCHDCHSRHNILSKEDPDSTVHAGQLPVTCGGCHPVSAGQTGFFSWFPSFQIASHAKADFGAAYTQDNCLGCHQGDGAHGESEPMNQQTCAKCHFSPDLDGAMWGRMHPEANLQTQPEVFAAASIYQVLIIIGLVLFVGRRVRKRSPSDIAKTDPAE